ncbi:MAG: hypothetical protein ACRELD_09695 [Longimicrobiales bacterium]
MRSQLAEIIKRCEAAELVGFTRVEFQLKRQAPDLHALGGVPWLVESYLGTHTDSLPPSEPDLPPPVDAVWIMYGRRGLRWHAKPWSFFDAVIPAE